MTFVNFALIVAAFALASCMVGGWPAAGREAEPPAQKIDAVLDHVRAALGTADFPAGAPAIRFKGTIDRYGIKEEIRLAIDGQGRFRETTGGRLGEEKGFDGTEAWTTDWSRTTRPLVLRDRDRTINEVWLRTGLWVAQSKRFEIEPSVAKSTAEELALSVRHRDGRIATTVFLSRATWLPTRAVEIVMEEEHVYTFSEYSDGPGLRVPLRWTHTHANVTTTARLTREPKETVVEAAFAMTPRRSRAASYHAERAKKLELKRAASGHLLVKPTVDGKEADWFIFDTGASHSVIDKASADRLGLKSFGKVPVTDVSGTTLTAFRTSGTFELGPVTLADPTYIELDLKPLSEALGERIGGIVGYPIFQAAVVELDCVAPALTLHDPNADALPRGAKWQTLQIDNNIPIVEGQFDGGRTGWFRLDTGMTDTVAFYSAAVKKHKLLDGRKTAPVEQGGVEKAIVSRAGALEYFVLAGRRFERPSATFAVAEKGAFADAYLDGNIGQGFLREFNLLFDYGGNRIATVDRVAGK